MPKADLVAVASNGTANGGSTANGNGKRTLADFAGGLGGSSLGGGAKVAFAAQADAPSCAECGSIMIRNGSCYKCLNCGSTSGCS
jgi:ribonucleoside-diphosphate reductase alpha chain